MEIEFLPCPLCLKPHFEGVDALRTTLITVATSHLECPVCKESLLGLDKLTIHLFSHINNEVSTTKNEKPAREDCLSNNNEVGDDVTAIDEEINKSIETIKKQITVEKSSDGVKEKQLRKPEDEEEILRCDICNFNFSDKIILEMHQKLLHQTIPDKATGLYNYHCHLCSKKFKKRGSLMVHLRVAHYSYSHQNMNMFCCKREGGLEKMRNVKEEPNVNNAEDSCSKSSNAQNGQNKTSDNNNKQWECDVCSKMFTTKYFLKKHKRLHTGEMPYTCSLCNKSFTFQQSYHKHMLYHSSEKPYVCNECGRAFKELSTLQNHARIHSGERPFVCETCGKRFRQRVSYLVHRRIHTGVMPYKCTACDKSFRYKVSQRSHKCLASPPGSVVRNPDVGLDLSETSDSSQCILTVDFSTNLNFIPDEQIQTGDSTGGVLDNDLQKRSIILQNNEEIQITYNKSDLTSALSVDNNKINGQVGMDICGNSFLDTKHDIPVQSSEAGSENGSQDIFSMMLSPLLPEVESLCLSNNSPVEHNIHSQDANNEIMSTMNEESLKELIYGALNKCE